VEGVLEAMTRKKLRGALAVLLALGLALGGVASALRRPQPDTVLAAPAPAPGPREARIAPGNVAQVRALAPIERNVWRIFRRPDGKQIAFLRWDKVVEVFDAVTLRPLGALNAGGKVMSFAFSPDTDVLATYVNGRKTEVLFMGAKRVVRLDTGPTVPTLAFSPDGKLLATANYHTNARLWEPPTGRLLRILDTGDLAEVSLDFSPDGKVLAVGNRAAFVRLFEVATGKLLRILNRELPHEVRFRPDGKVLAVGYADGCVRLWSVPDGKLLREAKAEAEEVFTLDWSPRGDLLATAGLKSSVTLWEPGRLTALRKLDSPEWVAHVRFTPDGTKLLAAGGTEDPRRVRKVYVWGLP
jgi:WD40 repeat protein